MVMTLEIGRNLEIYNVKFKYITSIHKCWCYLITYAVLELA